LPSGATPGRRGAARPFIGPPNEPVRLGSGPARLGRTGGNDGGRSTALHVDRFWLCRSRPPFFLLFVDPSRAIQLVIIISTALSIVALPGLWRAIAPGLLLRLGLGSLAGLPLGLVAFRFADPVLVRALVGATILGFALLLGWRRHHGPRELRRPLGIGTGRIRTGLEVGTGLIAGIATALVGMAGPPLLICLLLRSPTADGAADPTLVLRVRLCSEPCFPRRDHRRARQNLAFSRDPDPLRLYRRPCGRPLGERVGADAFAILAILLLGAAGLYTLAAAVGLIVH
jgi:Sulfite exporter TauE/SafE